MKSLFETLVFVTLSLAILTGGFVTAKPEGGEAGGMQGQNTVTLQGAPMQVAELVADWQRPPLVQEITRDMPQEMTQAMVAHSTSTGFDLPSAPDVPVQPMNAQPLTVAMAPSASAPRVDTAPPPPPKPESEAEPEPQPEPAPKPKPQVKAQPKPKPQPAPKPAPKPQPKAKAKPTNKPKTAQPGSQTLIAAGQGGTQQEGQRGSAKVKALSAGKEAKLLSQWGAKIRSRVGKRTKRPKGVKGGTALVKLVVAPSGQLLSVSLTKSSGNPVLDQAVLSAVRSNGSFPKAPKQLTKARYGINLPIRVK